MVKDFSKYLSMNRNNPVMLRDVAGVLRSLDVWYGSHEITREEHEKATNKFNSILSPEGAMSFFEIFRKFKRLWDVGFYNLKLSEEETTQVVKAREMSQKFYAWANPMRHDEDNMHIVAYMRKQVQFLVQLYKSKDEYRWEVYSDLKGVSRSAVGEGLASRLHMKPVADVLKVLDLEAISLLDANPPWESEDSSGMRAFSSEKNLWPVLRKITASLSYNYLTNYSEWKAERQKYLGILDSMKESGEISEESHEKYYKYVDSNTSSFAFDYVPGYMPIETFSVLTQLGKDVDGTLVYPRKYIEASMQFALDFCRFFSDERLIDLILTRKLNVDLDSYTRRQEAVEFFWNELQENLEIFSKLGIISESMYNEYYRKGKEKFR